MGLLITLIILSGTVNTGNEDGLTGMLGLSQSSLPRFEIDSFKSDHRAHIDPMTAFDVQGDALLTIAPWSRKVTSIRWVHTGYDSALFQRARDAITLLHGKPRTLTSTVSVYDLVDTSLSGIVRPDNSAVSEQEKSRLASQRSVLLWQWDKGKQFYQVRLVGGGDIEGVGFYAEVF